MNMGFEEVRNEARTVELSGLVLRGTTSAILFSDGINEEWIPRSRVLAIESSPGGLVDILIPEWLAIQKGFV